MTGCEHSGITHITLVTARRKSRHRYKGVCKDWSCDVTRRVLFSDSGNLDVTGAELLVLLLCCDSTDFYN